MQKQKYVILLLFWLSAITANAQQEPSFSHYWAMEPSFNPAAAGKESKLNVTGAYAMTLTGFEHNPRTMYVAGDMPFMLLNKMHGVGLQLMSVQLNSSLMFFRLWMPASVIGKLSSTVKRMGFM